jgi:hypothetical protein
MLEMLLIAAANAKAKKVLGSATLETFLMLAKSLVIIKEEIR